MRSPSLSLSRGGPADLVLVALLFLACAAVVVTMPGHPAFTAQLALHGALLAGFAALVAGAALGKVPRAITVVASIAVVITLYTSLGRLGFMVRGRDYDAALSGLDRRLFGLDPAHVADPFVSRAATEVMSFVYLLHVASVYISAANHALGRDDEHRESFLFGLVLTYCLGYAGYLIWPAHGPVAFHAAELGAPLQGYGIHRAMSAAVAASGGAIGAFPSLHVGGTTYLCLFDLKRDRFRGLTYLPVVALVALSTVYLRFHYVVDWIGGAAIAALAFAVTPRILAAYQRLSRQEIPS